MYFSTAGGPVDTHLGFEYTKALTSMWGIKEFHNYCIDNLDIDPTQEKKLMREGIKKIMKDIKNESA